MTFPSEEYLIEKMAIACCEKDFGKGSCNLYSNKGGSQDCKKMQCYPYSYAETTFNALIAELPTGYNIEEKICGQDFNGNDTVIDSVIYDDRAEYYKQLRGMGK